LASNFKKMIHVQNENRSGLHQIEKQVDNLEQYGRRENLAIHDTCLHDQNYSGFFEGPAFIQPIRAIEKVFKKL